MRVQAGVSCMYPTNNCFNSVVGHDDQRTHTSAKETLSHRPSSGQGSPGVGANTSLAAAAPGTPTLTRSSISGGRFRSTLALAADDTWS